MAKGNDKEMDLHLAHVLERIGEVSLAMRRKQAADGGLSPLQWRILEFVNDHDGQQVGVARLAEELQVSKPTISDSVKLLVDRKRLLRKADKLDARAHSLKVTAVGKRELATSTTLGQVVGGLSLPDKEAMMLGLLSVLEGLFHSGGLNVQRMCWTCEHYEGDKKNKHRCLLLEKSLSVAELRTDCPEHELANS